MPALDVSGLVVRYGEVVAVDGVTFSGDPGSVVALLGPNGAGKTTTVETLEGYRRPAGGAVRVLGLDPVRDRDEVRQVLGVQLQSSELPERLRVVEALDLFASFTRQPADLGALLHDVGLEEKRDASFTSLSGGQRQRLSIALALVGSPEVVVFDELTTGLDPSARRDTWRLISSVRDRGVTIVLVTHFMEEAERLCDRVAVIDAGRIVDCDAPSSLVARHVPGERIWLRPTAPMADVLRALESLDVTDVHIEAGTLDDAFLALTGTALED